jgi:predicted amino acid dehydrogenase
VEDLRPLRPDERERLARERFASERGRDFDLASPPLLRLRLLRLGDASFRWIVVVHHAVGDATSVALFARELSEIYRAGGVDLLPPVRATFADIVAWHERAAEGGAPAIEHFRAAMAGLAPMPPLPDDDGEGGGETVAATLTEDETAALLARARSLGATPATLVLLAFARALARALGRTDLVVGTAVSGRDLPLDGIDRLFGCLVSALPVAVRLPGDDDGDRREVERALAAALAHASAPPALLARTLAAEGHGLDALGGSYFLSFFDLRETLAAPTGGLAFRWDDADVHFGAASSGTRAMLGAMLGPRLRLHVHGAAGRGARARLLEAIATELRGAPRAPSFDAAIVAYLPARTSLERLAGAFPLPAPDTLRAALFPEGSPRLVDVVATPLGRSGAVLLPLDGDDLDRCSAEEIARVAARGVALAEAHDARVVSLAGRLPSRTAYGIAVERARDPRSRRAELTTGHAATAAAVVRTAERALDACGRALAEEHLALVGAGSVGQAALELLLAVRGRPASLRVVDRDARRSALSPFVERLRARGIEVDRRAIEEGAPACLLGISLALGAASEGDAIRAADLPPGILFVDDSMPPLVGPVEAWERMRGAADVLIVSAGELEVSGDREPVSGAMAGVAAGSVLSALLPPGLPRCRVEPLLGVAGALAPALGPATPESALAAYRAAERLGLGAPRLHLGATTVPDELLRGLARKR